MPTPPQAQLEVEPWGEDFILVDHGEVPPLRCGHQSGWHVILPSWVRGWPTREMAEEVRRKVLRERRAGNPAGPMRSE